MWSGKRKYFCFLFIASLTLLQSHAEFNRLVFSRIFLYVIPVHVIDPWINKGIEAKLVRISPRKTFV